MADARSSREDQGDQRAEGAVAPQGCNGCRGTGIATGVTCTRCDGTGNAFKAMLLRAYRLGVGDGIAAMANATPNPAHLQRDVNALVEELKGWNE